MGGISGLSIVTRKFSDTLRYLIADVLLEEMRRVVEEDCGVCREESLEALALGLAERQVLEPPDDESRAIRKPWQVGFDFADVAGRGHELPRSNHGGGAPGALSPGRE